MKIYFAGNSGFRDREISWLLKISARLLSYYEIVYDRNDSHYQHRSFLLISNLKETISSHENLFCRK